MPLQPPTRPHSANPNTILQKEVFQRPASPAATNPHSRMASSSSHSPHASTSSMSKSRRPREAEWEDAWDSSSDREDERASTAAALQKKNGASTATGSGASTAVGAQAIPIRKEGAAGPAAEQSGSHSSATPASWASSFQHVSASSPSAGAVGVQAGDSSEQTTRSTSNGASGFGSATTAVPQGGSSLTSKLPPGGSWEIVETAETEEPAQETCDGEKVGPEAIRSNVDDILRDPLVLLASLSLDGPPTPGPVQVNPASAFPFLAATVAASLSGSNPPTANSASSSSYSSQQGYNRPSTPSRQSTASTSGEPSTNGSSRTHGSRRDLGRQRSVRTERKREKFVKALKGRPGDNGAVDIGSLRSLAWGGIPDEIRPIAWQLLLNYLPLALQPRLTTLSRKRKEYSQLVDQYFGRGLASLDQQIWHQIEIDVPRTRPGVPLWACVATQRSLERILYVWAIRHPASGYVQGINDLVTPFFEVFLSAYIDTEPELFDASFLPDGILAAIEADSFWCLSKLLDGIQDNYISHQPGIHRLVKRMSELIKRIDPALSQHLEEQGVEFMQFAFRWMNCLLMREMSVRCTIRMWDTYLAEGTDAFSQFHLYVCSALLVKYTDRLKDMDFQEIIMFLQRLPTQTWQDHDVELLLSEAYVLKNVWQGAENHFTTSSSSSQNGSGPGGGGFGMLGR